MMDEFEESRAQRKARKKLKDAVKTALQNEDTRYFVRWLLDTAGIYNTSQDAITAGRRDLGLEVVAMLNDIDPYEYVRLMKESADDIVLKRNKARKEGEDEDVY